MKLCVSVRKRWPNRGPLAPKWVYPLDYALIYLPPLLYKRHVDHALWPPTVGEQSKMRSGGSLQTAA